MIIKISQGKGFRGVLDYLLSKDRGEIMAGCMTGRDARKLATEFGVSRQLRRDIEKPVFHASLSLPPNERLDDETWERVVNEYLAKMGFDAKEHQWVAIKHNDTDHDHVHLVVSRISLSGKVWKDSMSIRRSHDAARALEKEFGLTVVNSKSDKFGEPKLKRGEVEKALREKEPPVKLIVSEAVKEAVADKPDIKAFVLRLWERGIKAIPNVASTGRMNGFSFVVEGRTDRDGEPIMLKGSDVGANWGKLKELVDYEVERDGEFLKAAKAGSLWETVKVGGEGASGVAETGLLEHEGVVGVAEGNGGREQTGVGERSGLDIEAGKGYEAGGSGDSGDIESIEDAEIEALLDSADDTNGIGSWADTADAIVKDAMDTELVTKTVVDTEERKKAHLYAKEREWEKQAQAMGAQRYRITCVSRTDGRTWNLGKHGEEERFWSAEDVKKMLPRLSALNAQGRDIYITPVDPTKMFFLLDDLKWEQVEQLKKDGFKPALVIESSKDNFQALLVCDRKNDTPEESELEKAAGRQVHAALCKRYGSDKGVASINWPFRVAGFNNKKPTRNNFIVRLISHNSGSCEQVRRLVDEEKSKPAVREKAAKKSVVRPIDKNLAELRKYEISDWAKRDWEGLYRKWRGLAAKKVREGSWEDIDYSVIDFRTACDMLKSGYDREEVAACLAQLSPEFPRGHGDSLSYIERTLNKAESTVERERNHERGA